MQAATLKTAIDLLFLPSQARFLRSAPVPHDVDLILKIVAGDEETTGQAALIVGRSCDVVREAAAFFVQQILLFPEADSYRILGSRSDATNGELRRNMTLLLRWLHPDVDLLGERSVFASRVTGAWNNLKTPERRAAYDRQRLIARVGKRPLHSSRNSQNAGVPNHWTADKKGHFSGHRVSRPSVHPKTPRSPLRWLLLTLFRRFAL
jgi:hypothetical protein